MLTLICMSALCFGQVQVPPIQNPPVQNPQIPPPQNTTGQPPNNQDPTKWQMPPGQYGSMFQVPVDGTYQVLAYEKFGQILPGMNTLKVVIRNNILIFPGDGKFPGKMIQLAFGPNNTIMLTPLDSSKPNPWQTAPGTQPPVANGTNNQGAVQNPANTISNPANPNGGIAQAGIIQPSANSERGVYVLSTEFFSISVLGGTKELNPAQPAVVNNGQAAPGTAQPPVANNRNPPLPGTTQPPAGTTTPPPGIIQPPPSGVNSQAVLVLRRVPN